MKKSLLALLVLGALGFTAPPANAAPTGSVTITAADYQFPDEGLGGCYTHYWYMKVSTSSDVTGIAIDLVMTDPSGKQVDAQRIAGQWPLPGAGGYTATYGMDTDLCEARSGSRVLEGTYTITATATFSSGDGCEDPSTCPSISVPADSFLLTRQLPPWNQTGEAVRVKAAPLQAKVAFTADARPPSTRPGNTLGWRVLMRVGKGKPRLVFNAIQDTPGERDVFKRKLRKGSGKYRFLVLNMTTLKPVLRFKIVT